MKRILLAISMLIISSGAFAQLTPGTWFLGGTLQFGANSSTPDQYDITPSVGVMISNHWEVGLSIGYSNTASNSLNDNFTFQEFTVGPFVKYIHAFNENSSFYYQFLGDVNFGFSSNGTSGSSITVGISPGLAWNPVKHFIFNMYYGNISYGSLSENRSTTSTFNFNITPGTLTFGVEYIFPSGKSK